MRPVSARTRQDGFAEQPVSCLADRQHLRRDAGGSRHGQRPASDFICAIDGGRRGEARDLADIVEPFEAERGVAPVHDRVRCIESKHSA